MFLPSAKPMASLVNVPEMTTNPFVYHGKMTPESHKGSAPMSVTFSL